MSQKICGLSRGINAHSLAASNFLQRINLFIFFQSSSLVGKISYRWVTPCTVIQKGPACQILLDLQSNDTSMASILPRQTPQSSDKFRTSRGAVHEFRLWLSFSLNKKWWGVAGKNQRRFYKIPYSGHQKPHRSVASSHWVLKTRKDQDWYNNRGSSLYGSLYLLLVL